MTNVKVKRCVFVLNTATAPQNGQRQSQAGELIISHKVQAMSILQSQERALQEDSMEYVGLICSHLCGRKEQDSFTPMPKMRIGRVGMISLVSSLRCKDY